MISDSTQATDSTRSVGHRIRSSFTSTLRRKGSAIVSLSALLRKLRSSHRNSTNSHTLPTDPTEERPWVCHLEEASPPPPCEDWSDSRDESSSRRRTTQFWTVTGTGSRVRGLSADIEYTPRVSRARSLVRSLRKPEPVSREEDYTTGPFIDMPPPVYVRDLRLGLHDPSQDPVDMTISPLNLAYGYLCEDFQTWKNSNVASPQTLAAWHQKLQQLRALIDSLAETIPPVHDAGMVKDEASSSEQGGTSTVLNSGSEQSSGFETSDKTTSEDTAITDEVTPGPPPTPVPPFGYLGGVGNKFWWDIQCTQMLEAHKRRQDQQVNHDGSEVASIRTVDGSPRQSLEDELLQVGESFDGNGNVGAVVDDRMLPV